MKQYNAQYFKDGLPEWKRKKDPVLSKVFYRPVSFYTASFFANRGFSANTVSNLSTVVGILACFAYLTGTRTGGIAGALLVNLWLILDCTDGNIARSVRSQPYGGFVDALSSYTLGGLLYNILGWYAYRQDAVIFVHSAAVILTGALASSFDSLMRLYYQKYIVASRDLGTDRQIAQDGTNSGRLDKIRIRAEQEIGLGGILPLAILLGTLFRALDVVLILWCAYYGSVWFATLMYLIWKTREKKTRKK